MPPRSRTPFNPEQTTGSTSPHPRGTQLGTFNRFGTFHPPNPCSRDGTFGTDLKSTFFVPARPPRNVDRAVDHGVGRHGIAPWTARAAQIDRARSRPPVRTTAAGRRELEPLTISCSPATLSAHGYLRAPSHRQRNGSGACSTDLRYLTVLRRDSHCRQVSRVAGRTEHGPAYRLPHLGAVPSIGPPAQICDPLCRSSIHCECSWHTRSLVRNRLLSPWLDTIAARQTFLSDSAHWAPA
jgi:hypothetical protein